VLSDKLYTHENLQNIAEDPDYNRRIQEKDKKSDCYLINIKTLRQFYNELQDERVRVKQQHFYLSNPSMYKFKYVMSEDDLKILKKQN